MFNKTKSVVKKSVVNNMSYFKKIIGTKEIADNAKWIGQMWKSLTFKKKGRVETFEQAKNRLNVNDEDIAKVRRNYIISFYIVFAGFLFCAGMLIENVANKDLGSALSSIGIGSVLFACAFKFSFRAYQIKTGELCSVKKYLENKKEWIAH